MAVETLEGFDTFTLAQISRRLPNNTTSGSDDMVTGRYSAGQAIDLDVDGHNVIFPVTSRSEYYGGFDFQLSHFSGATNILLFLTLASGGSTIGHLGVTSSGAITTTWGDSSDGIVFLNTWMNIQFHIVISATVGVIEVRADGNSVVNLTGQNTGSTNVGAIELTGGNSADHTFDNFWVMNTLGSHSNGFPNGKMTVQASYPTSDGTYTQWTPNSGSNHFSRVNETTADDDTSFNFDTTAGHKDTYNQGGVTGAISQVHAVMVAAVVKKDAAGAKKFALLAKSGGTLNASSDIDVPGSYSSETMLLTDDPNTSSQWTSTNVNAVEIGVEVTA